MEINKYRC